MTVAAPPHLEILPVSPSDPILQAWCARLRTQAPHFTHAADYQPGLWIGLYRDGEMLAAYGYTICRNDVVAVEYALCQPSKAGKNALDALTYILNEQWKQRVVRFHCEISNRKMRKIVEGYGARPVALMYQLGEG